MAKLATFQDPIFQNEDAAREALETVLWPDGPICRQCGNVRAFHMELGAGADVVRQILVTNVSRKSTLVTDESRIYTQTGKEFAGHETMIHSGREYKNKRGYTTNNVENFFLQFKRGMRGTYIHCEPQHLQRYLNEFSFRYSNRSGLGVSDGERTALTMKGIEGKRLTYRPTN